MLAPLNRQGHRGKEPRTRLETPERFQGALTPTPCRPGYTQFKVQVVKDVHAFKAGFKAGFLQKFVKCRLRLFGLVKLSSSCLQLERYFSRCGESRERKGENVFRHLPPARGRCAFKRSLPPTLLARSSVQEDATSTRGRLVLHEAGFASYVAGTLSVSNTTVCDTQLRKSIMMADVRLEGTRDNAAWVATFMASPLIVTKMICFMRPR